MRGEQDLSPVVADDVGEVLFMFGQPRDAAGQAFLISVENVDDGQLQDALARFLEGGVEHFLHFRGQEPRGEGGCQEPETGDDQGQDDGRTEPDRTGFHGRPSL